MESYNILNNKKHGIHKGNLNSLDEISGTCADISSDIHIGDITSVEIETFSYCNRQCWFCPNSYIDRHTENIVMSEDVYLDILMQLKEIDYKGVISFSRYNEPFSKRKIILRRISQARDLLPNARLVSNTNGDYMTLEYIHRLKEAGLNFLNIQIYLSENEKFDLDNLEIRFKELAEKLKCKTTVTRKTSDYYIVKYYIDGIEVIARARNFKINGNRRGNSIDTIPEYHRRWGCFMPFSGMYIDYNGNVMPCCNLRSDIEAHKKYIMGNVKNELLEDILQKEKNIVFRDNVKLCPPHIEVCKGCSMKDNKC